MGRMAYSEAEYSILTTKILRYSQFLETSIEEYTRTLDYLMEMAIHDDKINAKLLKLKNNISTYAGHISEINLSLAKLSRDFANELEQGDKIALPDHELSILKSILNAFQ